MKKKHFIINNSGVQELYGKKNLSRIAEACHYSTVIRQVNTYGVETMCFKNLEPLLKTERRILRKMYGPKKTEDGYRHRPKEKLYRDLEDLETAFRRKRPRFLGHMVRMDRSRLNKKIFNYIWQLSSLNGYT